MMFAQIHDPLETAMYLLPLVVVISLVYSATRFEHWGLIALRTIRFGIVILGLMGLIIVLIVGFQIHANLTFLVLGATIVVMFLTGRRDPANS